MIGGQTSVPNCSGERNPDPKNLLLVPVHHFFFNKKTILNMKKLYRQNKRMIAGVCSGIGKYFNIDESVIRILFVILFLLPFPSVILYLLMWALVPKEPKIEEN